MLLNSLEYLLRSEKRARSYLIKQCWGKSRPFCVRCESRKIYHLAEKRYRCAHCGYTFQDFTGRWIGQLNLTARQWLWVLKLFELEISSRRIAKEVGISYPTALKASNAIRCAIVQHSRPARPGGGANMPDAFDFTCQRKPIRSRRETPVLGISEHHGKVEVSIVKDLSPETLLKEEIKMRKRGSLLFTGKFKSYDTVIIPGSDRFEGGYRTARSDFEVEGVDGFWSFAKERLMKFHGVSSRYFPLYLKEMEFRYNYRHEEELFELLADRVTELIPKHL